LFALQCAARLVLLNTSESLKLAARVVVQPCWLGLVAAIAVVVVGIGMQQEWTPLNWAFSLFVPVFAFELLADYFEDRSRMGSLSLAEAATTRQRPAWSWIPTAIAFFYAFGCIALGLQEEATPNMFSNLKVHGGSNHFILPTGLLFHWFGDHGDAHPFGGGVVRIEQTTSDWIQSIYPADLTDILKPAGVADVLEKIGNRRPSYFNPGANRVLGLMERGWVAKPVSFRKYTVPALELKRLLSEAKRRDKDFDLVYTKLPGTRGDEMWRSTAVAEQVRLRVRDGQVSSCRITTSSFTKKKSDRPCETTDLPLLVGDYEDIVPWWIRHVSLYHGYPIIEDAGPNGTRARESLVCFGP
jgi:hypothetical protein